MRALSEDTEAQVILAGTVTDVNERVRNRLLRRVDWRFLLPNPWPVHSLCTTGGSLARAVKMVSGSVSESPKGRDSVFDLAVARNPSPDTLREVWKALRPAGHCYTEWYRPWPNGLSQVRRQLREAGFTDVACYWPCPPRMPSQFWLPLDSPATLDRWRMRRQGSGVAGRRVTNLACQLALMLMEDLRTGMALPICALVRKPVGEATGLSVAADRPNGPPDLNELIRARWSSWGFGPTPDRLSWILATGGRSSINKVVGIVSEGAEGVPRLAVKMPRVPGSVAALESEAAVLASVHAQRPGGISGAPRVLFYEAHDGFGWLGETYLEGVPLFRELRQGNYRDYALKATDWLVELAGRAERGATANWWDRRVERLLDVLDGASSQLLDGSLLQRTRELLAAVEDLPIVCEHRDFSPWNVLVSPEGSLEVLDWESAELEGLPALDLIYFLTYLAFFHDGAMESGDYLESYRASLNPSTFTGGVRAECLSRYANAVGLDPAVLRQLGLLTWLTHAGSACARLRARTGEDPIQEMMVGSLFITLWQEELRRSG
jgi:hypothetical protein